MAKFSNNVKTPPLPKTLKMFKRRHGDACKYTDISELFCFILQLNSPGKFPKLLCFLLDFLLFKDIQLNVQRQSLRLNADVADTSSQKSLRQFFKYC